jgi:hypothetical protein
MSNVVRLDEMDPVVDDLDLDVRVSFSEQSAAGLEDGFGIPGGATSPNLTFGPQALCPECCPR